jgi:RNA polymerase sigma factor (sigma-70 family)
VAIINSSCEGDEELFAALYPALRRFAAVVGPAEEDPDDLVQEALERTLRRCRLAEVESPKAYLRRVILNLASNRRRRLGRARRALARLVPDAASTVDEYPSDLQDLLALPPHQRAVLYLAEVEGIPYAEIGRLVGCSANAARKRAMNARRRLHALIREEAVGA